MDARFHELRINEAFLFMVMFKTSLIINETLNFRNHIREEPKLKAET